MRQNKTRNDQFLGDQEYYSYFKEIVNPVLKELEHSLLKNRPPDMVSRKL